MFLLWSVGMFVLLAVRIKAMNTCPWQVAQKFRAMTYNSYQYKVDLEHTWLDFRYPSLSIQYSKPNTKSIQNQINNDPEPHQP